MNSLNFGTFTSCAPGQLWMVRPLGFGFLVYRRQTLLGDEIDEHVWGVPILPLWRFAFVAPWL